MLTTESTTWEGIFRVFSSQLEVTLEQAHLVDPKDPSKITDVKEVIVFPFEKVVLLTAANHDLTFAAKGKTRLIISNLPSSQNFPFNTQRFLFTESFQTDSQITGKSNGGSSEYRELEAWEPDADIVTEGNAFASSYNSSLEKMKNMLLLFRPWQ